VSRSIFALTTERDHLYFGSDRSSDQVGFIDNMRAVFGRLHAAEPDVLIEELRGDEAIAEADTLLLTVPNTLGPEDRLARASPHGCRVATKVPL